MVTKVIYLTPRRLTTGMRNGGRTNEIVADAVLAMISNLADNGIHVDSEDFAYEFVPMIDALETYVIKKQRK
jgi:hypothetical protein